LNIPDRASSRTVALPSQDGGRPKLDGNVALVSIGLALVTAFPVIPGKLQLGTVLCVVLFPFFVRTAARALTVRILIITLIMWAVGQVIADRVNGQGVTLTMPFILAGTILATTTTLTYLSCGNAHIVRFFTFGLASSFILWDVVLGRASISSVADWKYGLNAPVAIALLAFTDLAWRQGKRIPSFLALAAICGIGFWSDSRGLTGIAAMTAIFFLLSRSRPRGHHPRLFFAAASMGLMLGALSILFVDSANAGFLGERSVAQVRQFGSNPFSIMVNARPELYQELSLFLQRPLTGFGSHPHLSTAAYMESLRFVQSVGVIDTASLSHYWMHLSIPGVSAHSMAADSWARAGVLAVPFWILVVLLALWAGATAVMFRSSPLVVMWTMIVLWDTFFSPLEISGACFLGAYLTLAAVTITTRQRKAGRQPSGSSQKVVKRVS